MATGQPDFRDGTMLALYPDKALADALAVPGGLEPGELRMTVRTQFRSSRGDDMPLRRSPHGACRSPPRSPATPGFTGGDQDVIVALVDASELDQLRGATVDAPAEQVVEVPTD